LKGEYSISDSRRHLQREGILYRVQAPRRYNVKVSTGGTEDVDLNAALAVDAIEGETVVITGQALGQAGAINKQLSRPRITNVVAADKILELPDANAAESVEGSPGYQFSKWR